MSSSPNAQAGKRGDRILDEFALHQDPRLLYSIAYPGITWGGSLEIFSTHRGTHNFFNQLIEEIKHHGNPKGFSFHSVTLQDALEQGFLHKLQQKLPPDDPRQAMDEADYFNFIKSGCPDEETFLQEYMCTPGDDQSAFLSYNLIASCESPSNPPPTLPPNPNPNPNPNPSPNPQYIGVDLARSHDLTVIYILEKRDDLLHTRDILTFQNQPFALQEQTLYNLLAPENVLRCCIDQSGLGRQFTERAIERFGSWKVEGITFTPETKEKLAYPVRTAFENRTIRIPQDSLLRSDLRAIRKETTFAGNIRFTADRGKDGHADRFWALALALHAASRPEQTCGIEVVTYDY
jgi:phage FluMu gp28-like protein